MIREGFDSNGAVARRCSIDPVGVFNDERKWAEVSAIFRIVFVYWRPETMSHAEHFVVASHWPAIDTPVFIPALTAAHTE